MSHSSSVESDSLFLMSTLINIYIYECVYVVCVGNLQIYKKKILRLLILNTRICHTLNIRNSASFVINAPFFPLYDGVSQNRNSLQYQYSYREAHVTCTRDNIGKPSDSITDCKPVSHPPLHHLATTTA